MTDGSGQYQIIALETGTYTVTFTLPGFSTLVREDIELSTGFTANVDAQLAVGALAETVTVTEASPIIDVQSVARNETIDREVYEALPTARTYDAMAILIPAMNVQAGVTTNTTVDTGGISGNSNSRLSMHGSADTDGQVQLDGMDVGLVAYEGAPEGTPLDTAIAEYVYDYSANTAEVETGGVRLNLIPKEGSNSFSGGMYTDFAHSSWLTNNINQELVERGITGGTDGGLKLDQSWYVGPSIGGPIVRDRLWFFGTYSYRRGSILPAGLFNNADTSALRYVPDLENPTVERTNLYEGTLRLTWQATSKDKVQAFQHQPYAVDSGAVRRLAVPYLHCPRGGQRRGERREHLPVDPDPAADQPGPVRVRRLGHAVQQHSQSARRGDAAPAWHGPGSA